MNPYPRRVLQDVENRSFTSFLDLMRWMAAAIVFLSHLRDPLFLGYGSLVAGDRNLGVQLWYFVTGWFGEAVIVFFVLSGYLVGGIACAKASLGRFSIGDYAVDRCTRLYVAFAPALLLTAILDIAGSTWFADTGFWTHTQPMVREKIATLPFLAYLTLKNFFANLFMLQTIVAPPFGSNQPLWTISLEFWFYVVFGLGLASCLASVKSLRLLGLCALGILFVLLGIRFPGYLGLWLFGVIAAFVPWRAIERPPLAFLVFAGILVFSRAGQEMMKQAAWWPMLRDYLVAASFAWLLVSMRSVNLIVLERACGFNRFMADFSYSLYLIHFPLLLFLLGALHATGLFDGIARGYSPTSAQGLFVYGVVIALTYLGAWLFSTATERRTPGIRRMLKQMLVSRGFVLGRAGSS